MLINRATGAPAAYYDIEICSYVVFWASSLYNESDTNHTASSYERMLLATTDDFVTFSEPVIWQDAGTVRPIFAMTFKFFYGELRA